MRSSVYRHLVRFQKHCAIEKKKRILNTIKTFADSRSRFTEHQVSLVLESLKAEGKIVSYYLTDKWSRQDKQKIDAVVFRLDGTKALLQIKSSEIKAKRFRQEHENSNIRAVFVDYLKNQSFEELKDQVYVSILRDWHWN